VDHAATNVKRNGGAVIPAGPRHHPVRASPISKEPFRELGTSVFRFRSLVALERAEIPPRLVCSTPSDGKQASQTGRGAQGNSTQIANCLIVPGPGSQPDP
jgi:hypothetical protein